jgi:hypothetical protein
MHILINAEKEIRKTYFHHRPEIELESRYYPRVQRVLIRAYSLYDLTEVYVFSQDLLTKQITKL